MCVGQPLWPTAAPPPPRPDFPGPLCHRVPGRASVTVKPGRDSSHLPNFALKMCSLDFVRQARVAHCRHPSLTCLSRFLIPPRAFTIIANPSRVFFPEKDIHHDRTQPPSPVQELLQLPTGRGSQQVFLKRLYPPEDRKENIPFEHLVTHIKGNNTFNLHLHRTGIRCGPVTLSSA